MSGSTDPTQAARLLRGLENGGMAPAEARVLAEELDPVLVYAVVRFLRETYPASHPAATAVLERVVALTSTYPGIVEKSRQGEQDPVSAWFANEHSFAEFRGRGHELVELIADKLNT